MDRLVLKISQTGKYILRPKYDIQQALARLAAYEDIGLTPEELNERLQISPQGDDKIDELEEAVNNLQFQLSHLKQGLAEGRIIELPCRIGDTVYVIAYNHCCTCPDLDYYSIIEHRFDLSMFSDINRKVFLSREAAEAHLAEIQPVKTSTCRVR